MCILELGCGPGYLWDANRDRIPAGWDLTLTDFSAGMVEAAVQKLNDLNIPLTTKVVDAQSIPYEDGDLRRRDRQSYALSRPGSPPGPSRNPPRPQARRLLSSRPPWANGIWKNSGIWWRPSSPTFTIARSKVATGFTLENGAEQIAEFFDSVTRDDYEDDLEVTEVRPVEAYLKSSPTLMNGALGSLPVGDSAANGRGDTSTRGEAFTSTKPPGSSWHVPSKRDNDDLQR